jgi:hypothetical protein
MRQRERSGSREGGVRVFGDELGGGEEGAGEEGSEGGGGDEAYGGRASDGGREEGCGAGGSGGRAGASVGGCDVELRVGEQRVARDCEGYYLLGLLIVAVGSGKGGHFSLYSFVLFLIFLA